MSLTVAELIAAHAATTPDGPAVASIEAPPLCYQALDAHLRSVADSLRSADLGPGDTVALVLPNGPEMATCFLAVTSVAICAPLNPAYRLDELDFYLRDLGPKAVIVPAGVETPAREVAGNLGIEVLELRPRPDGPAGVFELDLCHDRADRSRPLHPGPRREDVAVVLHTSGTSGRPKRVPLTHRNLTTASQNIATALQLTGRDTCLNIMPLFHIHGLVGAVLSSLAAGGRVVCTAGFDAATFIDWLQRCDPSWYTAVPTIHHAIASRLAGAGRPAASRRLRFVRSSSSPMPPPLMADLERLLDVPVIESYGMTEASHQIATNPLPPGRRKAGSVGRPAGADVAIVAADGRPLPAGAAGEVVIRGPSVTRGYLGADEPSAPPPGGWLRTGDQGYLDEDGYLYLTGRLKEIINRGGEKVSPLEVEAVLREHPAVDQVVCFALPDERLGEEVAAAVVLREDGAVEGLELKEFVAGRLADFKVPRRIVMTREVPRGSTGKVQRVGLAARLGFGMGATVEHRTDDESRSPRSRTERRLMLLWSELIGTTAIGRSDDFFQLGGDSLIAARVASRVRHEWGIDLPLVRFFDHPTIEAVARWLDEQTPSRTVNQVTPIPCRGSMDPCRLSFGQQRFWFLDKLSPDGPMQNTLEAFRWRGALSVEVLEDALTRVIDRHEILRTTYHDVAGTPVQAVTHQAGVTVSFEDLRHLPPERRKQEAHARLERAVARPFDLSRDLPIRVAVYRLASDDHLLLLALPHIASDGWSLNILHTELAELYAAAVVDRPATLPQLPIQYADFALWEARRLSGDRRRRGLEYWSRRLVAPVERLALPTDRAHGDPADTRSASVSLSLPSPVVDHLAAFARAFRVSTFTVVAAAFQALLGRLADQTDVVIGSAMARRGRPEVVNLIGLFTDTVVLRLDLSGDPTFEQLVGRAAAMVQGALTHQDVPFEQVVQAVNPVREANHNPFFDIMLEFNNRSWRELRVPGVQVSHVPVVNPEARFAIALHVNQRPDGLHLRAIFRRARFGESQIDRLLAQFGVLLESATTKPATRLSALPILPAEERRRLLVDWNDTERAFPEDRCVHELVEAQVARTPEAVAVTFEGRDWTYRELNRRANRVAQQLRRSGLEPEGLVGLHLARSPAALAVMLGVLKGGAAYVPLDPHWPAARLARVIEDARLRWVVTDPARRSLLPDGRAQIIDTDDLIAGDGVDENPAPVAGPRSLAYVMYTSGSTGTPKGVMIEHRSLVNYAVGAVSDLNLGEMKSVAALQPLSVDSSVTLIYGSLLTGGRLHLVSDETALDPKTLREYFDEHAIDCLKIAPSHLMALNADLDRPIMPNGLLVLGGEESSRQWVGWLAQTAPGCRIVNHYGPTEATVGVTTYPLAGDFVEGAGSVPIGRPLPNASIYILDRTLRPVATGTPGELCIGGVSLARGYLGRPRETAKAFVPDPFGNVGARLYRTGDIARYREDGTLEFLGRRDGQLKIRGFRVERGEVEAAIARHPAVKAAAVVLHTSSAGAPGLAAVVVPTPETELSLEAIRDFLEERLPQYMMPSPFVSVDALPRTPHGKLDRPALEEIVRRAAATPVATDRAFKAPETPLEKALSAVWSFVLGRADISVDESFFDAGGHSIAAIQVVNRMRADLSRDVSVQMIFEHPTIAQLAAALDRDPS